MFNHKVRNSTNNSQVLEYFDGITFLIFELTTAELRQQLLVNQTDFKKSNICKRARFEGNHSQLEGKFPPPASNHKPESPKENCSEIFVRGVQQSTSD